MTDPKDPSAEGMPAADVPRRILRALSRPFGPDQVKWRLASGAKERDGKVPTEARVLAYFDARAGQDRFDKVLGLNWNCSYAELRGGKIVVCTIAITVNGQVISRSNGADDTDIEPNMGAMSTAFRRAATMFGVGRELYGYPSPKVKIRPWGKSFVIEDAELPKLRKIVEDRCKAWDAELAKKDTERAAKSTSKPAVPAVATALPVAPQAVSAEEQAQQLAALTSNWEARMGEATTGEQLKTIGEEIAAGPFAQGSNERKALLASWTTAMKRINPQWAPHPKGDGKPATSRKVAA